MKQKKPFIIQKLPSDRNNLQQLRQCDCTVDRGRLMIKTIDIAMTTEQTESGTLIVRSV